MAAEQEETRLTQEQQQPADHHVDGLASEHELWQRFAAQHDPATREELVRRYLPFAKNLALRYRGASESFDDLLQVASLGLVNAIDRLDPARGTPFAAFASRRAVASVMPGRTPVVVVTVATSIPRHGGWGLRVQSGRRGAPR